MLAQILGERSHTEVAARCLARSPFENPGGTEREKGSSKSQIMLQLLLLHREYRERWSKVTETEAQRAKALWSSSQKEEVRSSPLP